MDEGPLIPEGEAKPRGAKLWLMTAVACGAIPMMSGVIVLVGFLLSLGDDSRDKWISAGAVVLTVGLVLFCLGLASLCAYLILGRRRGVLGRDLAQNTMMTLILLFVNFPTALACIWVADDAFTRVRIQFVNDSTTVVEDLNITWPGGEQHIGDLAPDDTAKISFHVSGDGTVDFTARQGGEPCEGNLIGYVTLNMGETDDVVFLGDCLVRVEKR